jgi:two-component system phosphate regulon sensor histidine kinase PhoR
MAASVLQKLAQLLTNERERLLSRWRAQVCQLPSARDLDTPRLVDHIPLLLDELVLALATDQEQSISDSRGESSATSHGLQRAQDAFDIAEVVAEYNILRSCIHDLTYENGLALQGKAFHIINGVLDHAIALALHTYMTQRALDIQRRREEYLAFVAHDLRTPLSAISLAAKVLETTLSQQGLRPEIAQMFRALSRNVKHLETLVTTVLHENAHLQTETGLKLELREFYLWPFVEALIHDLHPVAGTASTQLINAVEEDLIVYADASLLRRVLQNLIANAIRYTPRGEVTIGAKQINDGKETECWVTDNGAGIPEELIERVFDKGETGPENETGTGLGLAIVKTFTEAHGGRVDVISHAGQGATFRFWIPTKSGR